VPPPGDRPLRRRLLTIGVGLCVLLVVVAVVALAGGLDRVPPEELPVAVVDQRNEGQPWNVTVAGAVLAADLSPAVLQEEGYWLAVVADVEVTADQTRTDVYDILCVTDVQGLAREHQESSNCPGGIGPDDVRLYRDASAATSIHPGLPERLAFLWELAGDTEAPAEVHVEVVGKTYREDSLTGSMAWLDAAPRVQLRVPIEDRREQP
jgi:hypothetical protein